MRRTWNAERKFFRPEDETALGHSQPSLTEVRRIIERNDPHDDNTWSGPAHGRSRDTPDGRAPRPT
ncbi:hypothetical protein LX15_001161 [Streptoalloteichus tenebrarius]|uniref:Uncharacterized protein n=1 Tax=Streptoalloteichus tenebrarius (strain ATCC 17920 / DSM 40477 / JCM 4838 / CBS 697.72 / NBRC 16177 / NCIMB 11028 / NRRL B-12390 / A12253. 1 / ISP 5477) TaxID=1933 RepID=A0ABT1HPN3_STRSD|nr:hypothetical protein [Streptoalloteichus tenebrarius]BFE98424.1 hypothetical protein GCM10020241_01000 [Streptoalloteichus tenebrarius]